MCVRRLTNYTVSEIDLRKKGSELLAPGRNVINDWSVGFTACIQHGNVQSKMFAIENGP